MTQSRQQYIEQHAEYAMEQMRKYGIPASVTLAQGIIESADGRSMLAKTANNHFGIKGDYNGSYVLADDDKPNEKFKQYDTVAQSYEDHSKVLMSDRYQKLTEGLAADDYRSWATAIKAGGYASNDNYVNLVCKVIEGADLQKYDQMVIQEQANRKNAEVKEGNEKGADMTVDPIQQELPPTLQQPDKISDWKKLLAQDDTGMGLSGNDPIVEMIVSTFASLLALATQMDNQKEQQAANELAKNQSIDLTSLLPQLKECSLTMRNGNPVLLADNGQVRFMHELTNAELARMQQVLGNENLSEAEKQRSVGRLVNGIVIGEQLSANFDQGMDKLTAQARGMGY